MFWGRYKQGERHLRLSRRAELHQLVEGEEIGKAPRSGRASRRTVAKVRNCSLGPISARVDAFNFQGDQSVPRIRG
jgi:hypothetical protein